MRKELQKKTGQNMNEQKEQKMRKEDKIGKDIKQRTGWKKRRMLGKKKRNDETCEKVQNQLGTIRKEWKMLEYNLTDKPVPVMRYR